MLYSDHEETTGYFYRGIILHKRMTLVFVQKYCILPKYNYYYFMFLIIIKNGSIKPGRYMFSKKTGNKFGFTSHT